MRDQFESLSPEHVGGCPCPQSIILGIRGSPATLQRGDVWVACPSTTVVLYLYQQEAGRQTTPEHCLKKRKKELFSSFFWLVLVDRAPQRAAFLPAVPEAGRWQPGLAQ